MQLAGQLGPGVTVRDWTRTNRNWFTAVQLEKRLMFIILTLIVAVAAFNLVSTLVMTVTDKNADIAILRTLGASPRSVMGIFMVQGAAAGVIGTLCGVLSRLASSTSSPSRSSSLSPMPMIPPQQTPMPAFCTACRVCKRSSYVRVEMILG